MRDIFEHLLDRLDGKAKEGQRRSSKWRKVRAAYIKKNPKCVICEGTSKLTVHHIIPFHFAPELELEEKNLMTLCQNKKYGINCHLLVGHLGNFQRINYSVKSDAAEWHYKLKGDDDD